MGRNASARVGGWHVSEENQGECHLCLCLWRRVTSKHNTVNVVVFHKEVCVPSISGSVWPHWSVFLGFLAIAVRCGYGEEIFWDEGQYWCLCDTAHGGWVMTWSTGTQ